MGIRYRTAIYGSESSEEDKRQKTKEKRNKNRIELWEDQLHYSQASGQICRWKKCVRKQNHSAMTVLSWHAGGIILKSAKPMTPIAGQSASLLDKYGLKLFAISNHLVGQAVADRIDERHKSILPDYVWGDGDPEGVRKRAAEEMIKTGEAAKRLGVSIVNGFTGSPIWHLIYSFPAVPLK